jgi:secreted trypsin-like serine protease
LNQKKNYYTIVGVSVGGGHCGNNLIPSIFASVEKYLDWIESIVWPGDVEI